MGFRASTAGTYYITLSDFDGLFTEQDIFIEDKLLNVIHNLKGASYTFASEAGTFDERFVLRYTSGTTLGTGVFTENTVVVYKNDNGIQINTGNINMEAVKIYDIGGRLLFDKKGIDNSELTISTLTAGEQVLIVQITSVNNQTINKKIVH